MKIVDNICVKVMSYLPEQALGYKNEYRRQLYGVYGDKDVEEQIQQMRYKHCKCYVILAISFAVFFLCLFFRDVVLYESVIYTDKDGQQYIIRPEKDVDEKSLLLNIEGVDYSFKKDVQVRLKTYENLINQEAVEGTLNDSGDEKKDKEEIKKQKISSSVGRMIDDIEEDHSKEKILLPKELDGVGKIIWSQKRDNSIVICMISVIAIGTLIYFQRYDEVKKLKKKSEISIEKELPDFLNKLVLLMNAGLVLSAAFEKIIDGYHEEDRENSYFYEQLKDIKRKMVETNSPMIYELKAFSERSGNREFMRVTNLMCENMNKGSKLVEALENESNFLWFQRKKKAEERGRVSETKLTLPLAMELVALIVITIMPAMLEM